MYIGDLSIASDLREMGPEFRPVIEAGFKDLLEGKHLYQNLSIPRPKLTNLYKSIKQYASRPMDHYRDGYKLSPDVDWYLMAPGQQRTEEMDPGARAYFVSFDATLPTIMIYCERCDRVEAHNPLGSADILENWQQGSDVGPRQLFLITYLCQGCKVLPIVFLVRRSKLKLSINGRCPMESVTLPSFLPKEKKKYVSDAIVAFQSGQVLAANFLLRTFIEQYIRSQNKEHHSKDIEALFDEYQAQLSDTVRNEFPSLRATYERLSIDIHGAIGSADEFEQSLSDVKLHFEGKEIIAKATDSARVPRLRRGKLRPSVVREADV